MARSRPRRRFRRRTYRLRRRWHRAARPFRRSGRVAVMLSVLTVAVLGTYATAVAPLLSTATAPVTVGAGGEVVVSELERGAFALAGLRPGDRLLAVEGDSLAVRRSAQSGELSVRRARGDTITVRAERAGRAIEVAAIAGGQSAADARRFGLSPQTSAQANRALLVLAMAAFVGVGSFLFVRARAAGYLAQLGVALVSVAGLFGFGRIQGLDLASVLGPFALVLVVLALAVAVGALPAVAKALVRFPDGRSGPRWTRRMRTWVAVGLLAVVALAIATEEFGFPDWVRDGIGTTALIGIVALPAVGLVQKYRRSADAVVRQQMKWVVLPLSVFVVALTVPFLGEVVPALDSDRRATGYLFNLAMTVGLNVGLAAVPLGVLAGALNFRPWDADLWIARSVAVGAATLGLAAVFAGGAEALRLGLRASMGDGAEAVAAALAAVAALVVFNPVREWVTKRADRDLARTRERLTERLPLLLAGRQVVASPGEVGRVAIAAVREALATGRAAVLDLDPEGWEVVAADGVEPGAALAWAEGALDPDRLPACAEQCWEDPVFVLRVPLRSAEDELVGVLALGTHGRGRGYSTEERRALDAASRSLAEALRVAERREAHETAQRDRIARLVERVLAPPAGDGAASDAAPV